MEQRRWHEAAEMISEALRLDPSNTSLRRKLLEVKDAPWQFKIQANKKEAEAAIDKGNFEKAVDALEAAVLFAPEDTTSREWLEATLKDQNTAQLTLYRKRAQDAIKIEDWEAAVAAREAALHLIPSDPSLTHELEETKKTRHKAKLDDAQIRAEEAHHSQNWDTAIQAAGTGGVLLG